MGYTVRITRKAAKQLARLDRTVHGQTEAVLTALADDPRPRGVTKLQGSLAGCYRIRVGIHHRVVYTVTDATQVVEIIAIGSREGIY